MLFFRKVGVIVESFCFYWLAVFSQFVGNFLALMKFMSGLQGASSFYDGLAFWV